MSDDYQIYKLEQLETKTDQSSILLMIITLMLFVIPLFVVSILNPNKIEKDVSEIKLILQQNQIWAKP